VRWVNLTWYRLLRYIARYGSLHRSKLPKVRRDYFGLVVNQPPKRNGVHPINGFCATCGYQLKGWHVIVGRKRTMYCGGMPKVFG
jgi:hypothetical protein